MKDVDPNDDGLAIFVGTLLHHISNETDEAKAYQEYASAVGFDTERYPKSASVVHFVYISEIEMPEWVAATATDYPEVPFDMSF